MKIYTPLPHFLSEKGLKPASLSLIRKGDSRENGERETLPFKSVLPHGVLPHGVLHGVLPHTMQLTNWVSSILHGVGGTAGRLMLLP